MTHADVWWHRPWIRTTETLFAHAAAIVVGLVLMVIGLGLGVTMIMLPVGLVVGLIGVTMVIGGLFADISRNA